MDICWSDKKNELLKATRKISFEQVKTEIDAGRYLGPVDSLAKNREGQQIVIVSIDDYPVAVPFVIMENGGWFLKTAYPCRKYKGGI